MCLNIARLLASGGLFLLLVGRVPGDEKPPTDLYGDSLPEGALVRMGSVRLRHNNAGIAYSEDGKALISAGGVGDIRFWDTATGKELRRVELQGPRDKQASLRGPHFAADGKRFAVWEQGRTASAAVVYDTATGKELHRFPTEGAAGCNVIISGNGDTLASDALPFDHKSRTIRTWDLATGKKQLERVIQGTVWGVALSPDGRRMAWSNGRETLLWDATTGEELGRIPTSAFRLLFSPDGKMLVGPKIPRQGIKLWDSTSLQEIRDVGPIGADNISLLAFGRNGVIVLSSWQKNELVLLDAVGKEEPRRIPGTRPQQVAFSADGKALACADELSIRIYDVATGKPQHDFPGHRDGVAGVAVSPDGKVVASAAGWRDSMVHLWDAATGKLLKSISAQDDSVCGCEFSRDGKQLLTGGMGGTLQLWEWANEKERRRFQMDSKRGFGLAMHHSEQFRLTADAKHVIAVGLPNSGLNDQASLYIWEAETGKLIERRPFTVDYMSRPNPGGGSASRIRFNSCFSPDGALLTPWSNNGLQITEVLSGRALAAVAGDLGRPSAFSPDARLLVAGIHKAGVDPFNPEVEAIGLYETATGKEVLRLEAGTVQPIAFSPDGRWLVTADVKGMRVWDVGTGKVLSQRAWPEGFVPHPTWTPVGSLTFLPDGKRLVTGVRDGTSLVWDMTRLTRDLKPATSLDAHAVRRLWDELSGDDARKAHRAQALLAASPAPAIAFLKAHLPPVRPVDVNRVEKLIGDLESEKFAIRDAAANELAKMAEQIEPLLKRVRETTSSAEVKRRIATLLGAPYISPSGQRLCMLRAIAVLERIGTPEARDVLRKVGSGDELARETREAKQSLERLERRAHVVDQQKTRDR
jgi:WD40 repeat protein